MDVEKKNTLEVILVEPMKAPRVVEIDGSLKSMQELVGGDIEEYMPYEDDVAIVCNEEGKLSGLELNRAIRNEDGQIIDVMAGPFFICHAPPESEEFLSLPPDLKEKYTRKFKYPEKFFKTPDGIEAIVIKPKEAELER